MPALMGGFDADSASIPIHLRFQDAGRLIEYWLPSIPFYTCYSYNADALHYTCYGVIMIDALFSYMLRGSTALAS